MAETRPIPHDFAAAPDAVPGFDEEVRPEFCYSFDKDGLIYRPQAVGLVRVYTVDDPSVLRTGEIETIEIDEARFFPVDAVMNGQIITRQAPSTYDIIGGLIFGDLKIA